MSLVGAVPPHFRGLGGSLGPIPSRETPLGPECLLLSPGILSPQHWDGGEKLHLGCPAPSCTGLKPGLALRCLPPPLHVKQQPETPQLAV